MSGFVRFRNRGLAAWRRLIERPTPQSVSRAQVRLADAARDRGDWASSAAHYASALSQTPLDAGVHVQHAHALKELGRIFEAEGAYRAAIDARPDVLETYLHLAHLLRISGQPERSVQVFVQALRQDPGFAPARDALLQMGERKLLPTGSYGRNAAEGASEALSLAVSSLSRSLASWATNGGYPLNDYATWRSDSIGPPTGSSQNTPTLILIDARNSTAEALARTARSLQDQHSTYWIAVVIASKSLADHAVCERILSDPRFSFIGPEPDELSRCLASNSEVMTAWTTSGSVLDPYWLSWVRFAIERTRAIAVYSDHDHFTMNWRTGRQRSTPVLQGQPCPDDLRSSPSPPIALLMQPSLLADLESLAGHMSHTALIQSLLQRAFGIGAVVHVPHVLASAPMPTITSCPGQDPLQEVVIPRRSAAPRDCLATILVIIPTRDHADLLTRFVSTLRLHATQPERVQILIMDNRSREPATAVALAALQAEGAEIRSLDEPFNWSRINNIGAAGRTEDILVFANNDMEMLTPGWDDIVTELLDDPDRGIVGPRLLYPDQTIQHAGVALGVNEGRPFHEGLGSPGKAGGPLDRWSRIRSAAAVTGAFLAIRRDFFGQIGGFDEDLAIAYSDLDLCLRSRSQGRRVTMDPSITLIHFESKTRGLNDNETKISWDDHELSLFHARWGSWIFFDPSINPQWICERTWMFDGLRRASTTCTLDWIDLAGRGNPWRIDLAFSPPETR